MSESVSQIRTSGNRVATAISLPARLLYHLRSPSLGLRGELVRYALAGGTVAVVYMATTTAFATLIGLPFELALALGYMVTIIVHFSLQRIFVWIHVEGFALPVTHQVGRYLFASAVIYGVTALATGVLPGLLGAPTEAVYLVTAVTLSGLNFFLLRHRIFHGHRGDAEDQ